MGRVEVESEVGEIEFRRTVMMKYFFPRDTGVTVKTLEIRNQIISHDRRVRPG